MNPLIKKPSAWLPLVMSFSAFVLVLCYVAMFGINQEPPEDEGLSARIFQFLLIGQAFIVGYFVVRWFPEKPKQAFPIIALQIAAALGVFFFVYFLES